MVFQFKKPEPFRYGQNVTLPDGSTGKITAKPSPFLLLVKLDGSTKRIAVSENELVSWIIRGDSTVMFSMVAFDNKPKES